jgi:hypothetical protein
VGNFAEEKQKSCYNSTDENEFGMELYKGLESNH